MKIALYGGTFDPIHHGHLLLAREAKEAFSLDRVVFIPAAVSPHKLHAAPTSGGVRWQMVEAAIAGEPGFSADDRELQRTGPSYTYDTVAEWRAEEPGAELFYLVGQDNLAALDTWYRIGDLQKIATFLVLGRGEGGSDAGGRATHAFPQIDRRFDVAASDIRNRVAKGLSIRYLVSERVAEIIHQQRLYQLPILL